MPDYTLHYWPLPFRGQLIRAVLAHVGSSWTEAGFEQTRDLKDSALRDQACPHMGPPVLTDHAANLCLSQTQAILHYLGEKYDLMPEAPAGVAMTHKIIADTNDVLSDMTRANGAQMWTPQDWTAFQPRLSRWMALYEETGRRHGVTPFRGHMLGTDVPGLADLVTATLWGVMTERFPSLRPLLEDAAPGIAGLTDRIGATPEQTALAGRSLNAFGDIWCGGQIEDSLRAVLDRAPDTTRD